VNTNEVAKAQARARRIAGETGQGGIALHDLRLEQVLALENGGAKRRSRSEHVQGHGTLRRSGGLCHRLHRLRLHLRRGQAHQDPVGAKAGGIEPARATVKDDSRLALGTVLGHAQGRIDALTVHAGARKAGAGAHGGIPGEVARRQPTVRIDRRRRLAQGVDHVLKLGVKRPGWRLVRGRKGKHAKERGPRNADQQQQARPAGPPLLHHRRSQGQHGDHEQKAGHQRGHIREGQLALDLQVGSVAGGHGAQFSHGTKAPFQSLKTT
jgi:hypothetical protein